MDVVDYDKKAEEIINNYPFKAIAKDPTRKVESGINKCARQFFLEGKIKKPTYDWLRASSCQLPRFYGRVKIHKEGPKGQGRSVQCSVRRTSLSY